MSKLKTPASFPPSRHCLGFACILIFLGLAPLAEAATFPLTVTNALLGPNPVTLALTEADGFNNGGSWGNTVRITNPGTFFSGSVATPGQWTWRDFANLNLSGGPNPSGLDLLETTPSYGSPSLRTTIPGLPADTYQILLVQTYRANWPAVGVLANLETNGVTAPTTLRLRNASTIPTGVSVAGWDIDLIPLGQITGTNFSVLIGSAAGVERGDYIGLAFRSTSANSPVTILSQPSSQVTSVGSNVTFSVGAMGNPPPTYQWRKNGTNIVAATNFRLTIPNVQAADAATYTVALTNGFSGAVSSNAVLSLNYSPVTILSQPANQVSLAGSNVTFTIAATGNPSPTFQWRKNGTNILSATNSTFKITNVQNSNAGIYSVVLTNGFSGATSSDASLTIIPIPPSQPFAFYVATNGNDANPGTSNAPFATLVRARDTVRALTFLMSTNIFVLIKPGDYGVTKTIEFTPQDSGRNGYEVIYRADGDRDSVKFIGGEKVTGWQPYINGIFMAEVAGPAFHTLYENGKRARKARTPNLNVLEAYPLAQADYLRATGVNGSDTVLSYGVGDLNPTNWNLSGAQVFLWSGGNWAWFTDTVPIAGVDLANRRISLAQRTRYPIYQNGQGSRYFVQGILALLDEPGEFHYDDVAGRLYYLPMDGAPASQDIIVPRVKRLLALQGASESNRISHLRFEGLRFECTDFTDWFRHAHINAGDSGEGHLYPEYDRQMTLPEHRTGMIYCANTAQIVFDRCHLRNSGYSAMFWFGYNQSNTVQRCQIEHSGYSGIYLEGRYPGEGDVLKLNRISNSLIHDVGELTGGVAGVQIMNSGSNEVAHCDIYSSTRYGVLWDCYVGIPNSAKYSRGNWMHHLRLHSCCQDSGDTGALNCWAASGSPAPYNQNTIEQVLVDDTYAHLSMTDYVPNGIFMDNDSQGQIFQNVEVRNSQGESFRLNGPNVPVLTNVSWQAGFDSAQVDYAAIGVQADFPFPVMPSRVIGQAGAGGVSYLSWLPVANSVQYRVYRAINSAGPYALLGTIAAPGYVNAGGTSGQTCYYRVSSVTATGEESPASKSVAITTDAFPLLEDFESGLNRWTAGAGTLHLSTNQSHSATHSFVTDQDRVVGYMDLGTSYQGTVELWLYDPGDSATREVFARVDNSNWSSSYGWAGLGISTSVSSNKYCYRIETVNYASTVNRTPGWHRLNWNFTSGTNVVLSVDGTVVIATNNTTSFRTIAFGDWWAGIGTTGIYFDDLLIAPQVSIASNDTDHDGMDDTWERLYFNNSLATAQAGTDFDGDGFPDAAEYLAGTNPLDANSRLRITQAVVPTGSHLQLAFQSVPGRVYDLESTTNLFAPIWTPLQTNIVADSALTNLVLSRDGRVGSWYFRVRLR